MFLCDKCVNCEKYHMTSYGRCESCGYRGSCNKCPSYHEVKKEEKKMERVKVEIQLVCGCSLIEYLDPFSSTKLLRPIYNKRDNIQTQATTGAQYVGFKRSSICTEHTYSLVPQPKKLSIPEIKEILLAHNLSPRDAIDLISFINARVR